MIERLNVESDKVLQEIKEIDQLQELLQRNRRN